MNVFTFGLKEVFFPIFITTTNDASLHKRRSPHNTLAVRCRSGTSAHRHSHSHNGGRARGGSGGGQRQRARAERGGPRHHQPRARRHPASRPTSAPAAASITRIRIGGREGLGVPCLFVCVWWNQILNPTQLHVLGFELTDLKIDPQKCISL